MYDHFVGQAISRIYDCAVDAGHWADTLEFIRAQMDAAAASLQFVTFPDSFPDDPPSTVMFRTEWDTEWLERLPPLISKIPKFEKVAHAAIDVPVSQMSLIDEDSFRQSEFYREWVAPQGLRDSLTTNLIRRDTITAMLTMVGAEERALFSPQDIEIVRVLAPHFRRALLISDLLDEQESQIQVYKRALDGLATAVFLVEKGARVRFANAAGEAMLSDNDPLSAVAGKLTIKSEPQRAALTHAIDRACSGNDVDIQTWGNGVPLPRGEGRAAVAYVMPLGRSERRHALGPGVAAVFVTTDANARPPSIEVVSAMLGLTTAEANVALAIADGDSPQETAARFEVSVHTVRKHLANAFDKTGIRSQAGLSAAINRMAPPTARE